jgi:dienelactone hydrolase
MRISKALFVVVVILASVLGVSSCAEPSLSYLDRLKAHSAQFKYLEPAPQEYEDAEPPFGVEVVTFTSGVMSLKAWFALPHEPTEEKVAGVVFLHGGFSFAESDFLDATAFLDAGFALMTPMLRGENGNPGNFEMFLGEVDDAAAAVNWLATNPNIDPKQIYVFGHSVGGGLSALLALREGVPCVHTGSSGGLYSEDLFKGWSDIVPFDYGEKEERSLRVLLGNQRWLMIPHFAYIGEDDNGPWKKETADKEAASFSSKLKVEVIPGDHFSSLPKAIDSYIHVIRLSGE